MKSSPVSAPHLADASQMPSAFVIAFAGLLLSFNAISCDIMLPAFFAIQQDLGAGIERVQAIVPIFLMAAACGQLFFGPLSDRFGRRPVLLAGVTIYIAGCFLAGMSTSLPMLYGGRILQGTGAACGVVVARAVMRDVFSGEELARALSLAMAIFAIGPFLAPMVGASVTALAGWRGTFVALTLFGLSVWGMAWVKLAETNTVRDPQALSVGRLVSAFRRVLVHPQSLSFILVAILLQASVASLVINSPRLFKSAFGIDGTHFALAFCGMALGVVIGQLLSHRALARLGVLTTMRVAALINWGDALLMLLLERMGYLSAPVFVALLVLNSASFLVVMTNAMSLVIEPHRDIAGVAASVYGFLTQMTGSSLALLIIPLIGGAMGPWTVSNTAFASAVLIAVMYYRPAADPAA